jgi:hypothetical protein
VTVLSLSTKTPHSQPISNFRKYKYFGNLAITASVKTVNNMCLEKYQLEDLFKTNCLVGYYYLVTLDLKKIIVT